MMLRTYMMRLNYQYSTLITLKNYSIEVILLERKKRHAYFCYHWQPLMHLLLKNVITIF